MSSTGLDLPVLMSDEHIRRREFVISRRGYDQAQVREFLEQVADEVRQLGTLILEARTEAEAAAVHAASTARTDPYAEFAGRIAGVLRSADEEAAIVRREAKLEAELILAEARADADRIRMDAQARADEVRTDAQAALREAREQADRTISGLSTKRDTLVEQLAAMQERLIDVARELESTIGMPEPIEFPTRVATEARQTPADDGVWSYAAEHEPSEEPEVATTPATAPATTLGTGLEGETSGFDTELPEEPIVLGEADDHPIGRLADEADAPEGDLDDDAQPALLDRAFEGMWDGSETMQLEVPDIPPLDLDWGDLDQREDGEG